MYNIWEWARKLLAQPQMPSMNGAFIDISKNEKNFEYCNEQLKYDIK